MRMRIRLRSLPRLLRMPLMGTVAVQMAMTVSVPVRHTAADIQQIRVMTADMEQVRCRQQQLQQGNTNCEGRPNGWHFEGHFEKKQFPSRTSSNWRTKWNSNLRMQFGRIHKRGAVMDGGF